METINNKKAYDKFTNMKSKELSKDKLIKVLGKAKSKINTKQSRKDFVK